jgi:molecular chaperone GrpE (heat shock protein)
MRANRRITHNLAPIVGESLMDNPGDVLDLLNSVCAALAELRDELRMTNDRAVARERLIERLHDENQRLRAGERQLVLRPVLVDLQRLRNDLLREADTVPEGCTAAQAAALLTSFAYSVEQVLERGGVLVVRPTVGEVFDPARHQAVDVVHVDEGEDGTIARAVSDGYRDTVADRMLTPASVVVCRRIPAPARDAAPDPTVPEIATPDA